jgi:hypothetical protein
MVGGRRGVGGRGGKQGCFVAFRTFGRLLARTWSMMVRQIECSSNCGTAAGCWPDSSRLIDWLTPMLAPHLSACLSCLQGLVRVYTKKTGSKPDFGDPVVLRWAGRQAGRQAGRAMTWCPLQLMQPLAVQTSAAPPPTHPPTHLTVSSVSCSPACPAARTAAAPTCSTFASGCTRPW